MEKKCLKIEGFLRSQPKVLFASAEESIAADETKEFTAFVTPKEGLPDKRSSLEKEKVRQWAKVYDISYSSSAEDVDPEFNTAIWTSNYTGQPIQEEEMKEWVSTTVKRILDLNRNGSKRPRILEIGCGTGLLLYSLLPHVSEYYGIDNSEEAIQLIQKTCAGKANASKVKLFVADADDLSGLPSGKFDIIVINSVAQYFPSVEYLISVVAGLELFVDSNSTIFIGDINCFPLLEAFQSETQLTKASPEISTEELIKSISKLKKGKGRETFFDPRLFHLLPKSFKWINSVETQLRQGRFHNEMNNFRFDAILKCRSEIDSKYEQIDIAQFDWEKDLFTLEKVEEMLNEGNIEMFNITNVPNARTQRSAKLMEFLSNTEDQEEKVGSLTDKLNKQISLSPGIEPQVFWDLNSKYRIEVDWDYQRWNGKMSVRFMKNDLNAFNYQFEDLLISDSSNRPAIVSNNSLITQELQQSISDHLPKELHPKDIFLISSEMFALFKSKDEL